MSQDLPFDESLLCKYSEGLCTPDEQSMVESYLESLVENPEIELDLAEWQAEEPARLTSLLKVLHKKGEKDPPEKVRRRRSQKRILLVGAVAASLAMGGLLLFLWQQKVSPTTVYQVLSTSTGQHKSIILTDSSRIVLNENSTLRYPESFENLPQRELWLQGEGYFEVRHDPTHQFLVHCGKVTITDIGTIFNINADTGNSNVIVDMKSGSISVNNEVNKPVGLVGGQEMSIESHSGNYTIASIDTSAVGQWFTGVRFSNANWQTVLKYIVNHYHVNVEWNDPGLTLNDHLYATLPGTVPLDTFLRLINNGPYQFRYRIVDNTLYIIGSVRHR